MSFLQPPMGTQQNLIGSALSMCYTKFLYFWPIRKSRWLPLSLIGWNIFDFFFFAKLLNGSQCGPFDHLLTIHCITYFLWHTCFDLHIIRCIVTLILYYESLFKNGYLMLLYCINNAFWQHLVFLSFSGRKESTDGRNFQAVHRGVHGQYWQVTTS